MKYLVNNETKEHKIATPSDISAIGAMKDFSEFGYGWRLVEADSEGWIPWSGVECPLPDNALVCICMDGHRYKVSSPAANYHWGARTGIEYYRPILAEQEPDNHLSEEATRAINETSRRRFEEARTAHFDTPASVFDRLKSAIAASESIPAIIAEIDALLPDGYCVTRCGSLAGEYHTR